MISRAQTWGATPEEIFAKGLQESPGNKKGKIVRKGTIKALIDNVVLLNKELGGISSNIESKMNIKQTMNDMEEAITLLDEVFVFDVFPAENWFDSAERPGNILVGICYLKEYPDKLTQPLRTHINNMLTKICTLFCAQN